MTLKEKITAICNVMGMDHKLPIAIATVESSLGVNQLSCTGARGVFQMTLIAMKDLLLEMIKRDDEWVDILCGLAFIWVLKRRWGSDREIVEHYCDPKEKEAYWAKIEKILGEM